MTAPGAPEPMDDRAAADLLRGLVEIPSVSGEEARASAWLVDRAAALGFDAHVDEAGSAVLARGPADAGRTIVLLGHIDTVPGDIPVRIEETPDGPVLYGRGSVDAKGPLAAFVAAATRAALPDDVRLIVIGATEEEAATSRGARHALAALPPPAACIIGEPSGWDGVTLGYKGRLIAELSVERGCTHTAGPEASAADVAFAWWTGVLAAVAARNNGAGGAFDAVQASLRRLSTESDGLTDRASLTAGFRLPPSTGPDVLGELLRRSISDDSTLTTRGSEIAWRSGRDDACARAISAAIREAGGRPRHKVKTGTSDMNVVAPVWCTGGRCPIVAYGPGDSSLDHTPNERIRITEFRRATNVLTRALEVLAGELSSPRR